MSEAFSALTQAISIDASSRDVTLKDLCTRWSRYLPKVHRFSLEAHQMMMDYFKVRVKDNKPEIAFEVFIEEANTLTKDMSEILLSRAVLVFQDKTATTSGLQKLWKWFGFGDDNENQARAKNLGQIFCRCIIELNCVNLECHEVFRCQFHQHFTQTFIASKCFA